MTGPDNKADLEEVEELLEEIGFADTEISAHWYFGDDRQRISFWYKESESNYQEKLEELQENGELNYE